MSRINLVMLGFKQVLSSEIAAVTGKVFKPGFVLQTQSLDEAKSLVESLHIDFFYVDLDAHPIDLQAWNQHFPDTTIIGIASNPRLHDQSPNPSSLVVLPRISFAEGLKTELKGRKKSNEISLQSFTKMTVQRSDSTQFEDYSSLIGAN